MIIIIMMNGIIMNKSEEVTVSLVPETDFRYKAKARKVMVDFSFDAI